MYGHYRRGTNNCIRQMLEGAVSDAMAAPLDNDDEGFIEMDEADVSMEGMMVPSARRRQRAETSSKRVDGRRKDEPEHGPECRAGRAHYADTCRSLSSCGRLRRPWTSHRVASVKRPQGDSLRGSEDRAARKRGATVGSRRLPSESRFASWECQAGAASQAS